MCIPKFEKLENGACAQQILKIRDTRARVLQNLKILRREHVYIYILKLETGAYAHKNL